ncbi:MAG TPA: hypothetical protein VFD46_12720 [Chryseolinea sp.]|nr:hypothetical protein [Chryseolinea sp.]
MVHKKSLYEQAFFIEVIDSFTDRTLPSFGSYHVNTSDRRVVDHILPDVFRSNGLLVFRDAIATPDSAIAAVFV